MLRVLHLVLQAEWEAAVLRGRQASSLYWCVCPPLSLSACTYMCVGTYIHVPVCANVCVRLCVALDDVVLCVCPCAFSFGLCTWFWGSWATQGAATSLLHPSMMVIHTFILTHCMPFCTLLWLCGCAIPHRSNQYLVPVHYLPGHQHHYCPRDHRLHCPVQALLASLLQAGR